MKKHQLKKLLIGALAILLTLAVAGCGGGSPSADDDDDSLQKVLDSGRFVLGLDAEFPPMGFTDENGIIVGFDIDVAQEVCDRLGVALVKQPIDWDQKEDDLNSGKVDCIWNGMSVTPARTEAMNLSEPYMKNVLIVVVSGSSDVKTFTDLKGKKVGIQSGSTAKETLEAADIYADITVETFDTVIDMLDRLGRNEVDAVLADSVAAYYYIFSKDDPYYILSDSLGEEEYAIGFRKNDQQLRDKVQEILSEMKAEGTLGKISEKWFGSDITTVK